MIIWYSIWNFLAALYYTHSVYLLAAAGAYALIAFSSFFTLMVTYLGFDSLHGQQQLLRERRQPKNWKWPVTMFQKCSGGQYRGPLRRPRDAVIWLNVNTHTSASSNIGQLIIRQIVSTGIFQYPMVASITVAIVALTQPIW